VLIRISLPLTTSLGGWFSWYAEIQAFFTAQLGGDTIFKYLYKRRLFAAFGQFLNHDQLESVVPPQLTEWQALKSFLPRRWFYSAEQSKDAFSEVARLAAYYSRSHRDEPS
jgi:hypothetical protein